MVLDLRMIITATTVSIIVLAVAEIAVACSIFDFAVMNEMFYVNPSKTILIEPNWSLLSSLFIVFNVSVSGWTLYRQGRLSGYDYLGKWQNVRDEIISIFHLLLLIAAAGGALYLCIQFSAMANNVGLYTENAEPKSFQDAATWYFARLRGIAVLFGCSTALNFISFCLQNNFSDLHRKDSSSLGCPKTEC